MLCPLDVLAQLIVSMTSAETWKVDDLFDWIRTSHPYHGLPRRHFDLVLEMLAGQVRGDPGARALPHGVLRQAVRRGDAPANPPACACS